MLYTLYARNLGGEKSFNIDEVPCTTNEDCSFVANWECSSTDICACINGYMFTDQYTCTKDIMHKPFMSADQLYDRYFVWKCDSQFEHNFNSPCRMLTNRLTDWNSTKYYILKNDGFFWRQAYCCQSVYACTIADVNPIACTILYSLHRWLL